MLISKQSASHLVSLAQSTRHFLPTPDIVLNQPALLTATSLRSSAHKPLLEKRLSNWVIPNFLAIGQYPYPVSRTESNNSSPPLQVCEQHLRDHLMRDQGVTTFCSMQHELTKFSSPESSGADTEEWSDHSLGARFVNYQPDALKFARELGLPAPTFLHCPVIDLATPEPDAAASVLESILNRWNGPLESGKELEVPPRPTLGRSVYLHCWGGRGRAGTMGALLLTLLYPEISTTGALRLIQEGYNSRIAGLASGDGDLASFRSPETDAQCQFVKDFSETLDRAR
jgi:alanine transaminase